MLYGWFAGTNALEITILEMSCLVEYRLTLYRIEAILVLILDVKSIMIALLLRNFGWSLSNFASVSHITVLVDL